MMRGEGRTRRRRLWLYPLAFSLVAALGLGLSPTSSGMQCQILISPSPATVNYPAQLPSATGVTFGEILDLNYSQYLANQTVTVQYLNGTEWRYLQNFTANPVGFTETTAGLNSGWARLGTNTLRAVTTGCSSQSATFTVQVDQSASWVDLVLYGALVAGGVAFYLAGRWLGVGVYAALATIVYLAISPYTGQRYDIYFLLSSGIRVLQHVNPFDPGNPPIYPGALKWAYPPLYAAYSAASFGGYQLITGAQLPSVASLTWPGYLTSTYNVWLAFVPKSLPVLVTLLKLPMVVSAVGTAFLLRKMTGVKSSVVAWLANPLVILVAAVWGQLDPIATFLAIGALYFYRKDKLYHAYFLASLGAAVKVWPVVMIPIFVADSARRYGWRSLKPISATLPALVATLGLYAAYGNLVQTLSLFVYARGVPVYAGEFSVNGLTWQQVLFILHSPPVPLFLFVGIPLYALLAVWVYRRGGGDVVKWTIIAVLIFYLTYNYVNPQYFYWIIPLFMLQGRRLETLLFTALPMIYVAFSYNLFYFVSPALLFDEFAAGPSIVEQLKVVTFYTTPFQYVLISAAVPTLVYLYILRRELSKRATASETRPSPSLKAAQFG